MCMRLTLVILHFFWWNPTSNKHTSAPWTFKVNQNTSFMRNQLSWNFFFLFLPPIVIIQELYSLIHIYINYASFPTHMTISIVVICCMASSLVLRDKERAIISVTPTLGRGFVCSGVTSLLPDPEWGHARFSFLGGQSRLSGNREQQRVGY